MAFGGGSGEPPPLFLGLKLQRSLIRDRDHMNFDSECSGGGLDECSGGGVMLMFHSKIALWKCDF